ncbi:hypothetical protein J1N51_12160 [Psychrosphaera ytuae]|uniref:Uncharacterized protein n=1 Tax=Psychrosphaera ytuae TaxID=2820710 RepID=A0A975DAW7_9GAMM|nr:hypothetical protein [Psychrosphaera ytuae]QTH63473.1 hypothetical protein J1N51_12160 [Psychrosphaera ytuae]
MVNAQRFIHNKANQLSHYAHALLDGEIQDTEVDLYCWDTLEEWSQLNAKNAPLTKLEQAFWYLLHQITFWSSTEIRTSEKLQNEMASCISYLQGYGRYPEFCSGIRP